MWQSVRSYMMGVCFTCQALGGVQGESAGLCMRVGRVRPAITYAIFVAFNSIDFLGTNSHHQPHLKTGAPSAPSAPSVMRERQPANTRGQVPPWLEHNISGIAKLLIRATRSGRCCRLPRLHVFFVFHHDSSNLPSQRAAYLFEQPPLKRLPPISSTKKLNFRRCGCSDTQPQLSCRDMNISRRAGTSTKRQTSRAG
jgi:hypothetical protein